MKLGISVNHCAYRKTYRNKIQNLWVLCVGKKNTRKVWTEGSARMKDFWQTKEKNRIRLVHGWPIPGRKRLWPFVSVLVDIYNPLLADLPHGVVKIISCSAVQGITIKDNYTIITSRNCRVPRETVKKDQENLRLSARKLVTWCDATVIQSTSICQ